MFALGAKYSDDEEKYMNLGAGISNTCHESYKRSGSSHVFDMMLKLFQFWLSVNERPPKTFKLLFCFILCSTKI